MYVKRLRLENVRGFANLDFDFERPGATFAGWTVFVGGNSSGKTTLLRSIAVAMLGPEVGKQLMGPARGWILKGKKAASAALELVRNEHLDTFRGSGKTAAELESVVQWKLEELGDEVPAFSSNQKRSALAERGPWNRNAEGWFCAGYGPMRRLSGSSVDAMRLAVTKDAESRFMTLFREDAALSESEGWLCRMHSRSLEAPGNGASEVLKGAQDLLNDGLLPQGLKINRITVDQVFLKDGRGVELPMSDISDGCRSVYATVLNLVHSLAEVYGSKIFETSETGKICVDRPGVVIIDEVEAHLHPSWQRDFPYWLREHFPQIQFLVSTHSPLIAQAADPNGLFLLRVQNDTSSEPRRASTAEYERIRWGNAHKTVLGVAFGLDSTRTRWAAKRIERWQLLNAKKTAGADLTQPERKEHEELRGELEVALNGAPFSAI